jgi:hypothetical protein
MAPLFARARERAAQGQMVIIGADRRQFLLPAVPKESVPAAGVAMVERMLPSATPRNVAVIGDTSWTAGEKPGLKEAKAAIPFFGLLIGFASIGHAVWVFDAGSLTSVVAGCRDADVLIVDSACLEVLPPKWQTLVQTVMRSKQILVHDRSTNQLRQG